MNRTQLLALARECGFTSYPAPAAVKEKISAKLNEYFDTPEGKAILAKSPPCMLYTAENDEIQPHATTKDLVIKLLLQEF
jgi:hypothetical protein